MTMGNSTYAGQVPPVSVGDEVALTSAVHSSAKMPVGTIQFYKTSGDKWSVLKYYKSACTIALGQALADSFDSIDPNVLEPASTTTGGLPLLKGIAAANVSNTSYYSWCYIAGYVPDAAMPTNYASDQWMRLSASYTGRLSSAAVNATVGHENTALDWIVAQSLDAEAASTAASTNSVVLFGWWM